MSSGNMMAGAQPGSPRIAGPGVDPAGVLRTADARSLLALVESDRRQPTLAGSVAERWALMVLRVLDSSSDPKTLSLWARAVSTSRTGLCECCRLVHVAPHSARDFARVLRAISRSGDVWQPEAAMDVADARTLRKLLERAGLVHARAVPTLDEFFERQTWMPSTNPGLVALRKILNRLSRSSGLGTAYDSREDAPIRPPRFLARETAAGCDEC